MTIMKVGKGHPPIHWFGAPGNSDYAFQEGQIFNWSESNIRYETAWWLNADGTPVKVDPDSLNAFQRQQHIDNIMRDRPFDPAWMKDIPRGN